MFKNFTQGAMMVTFSYIRCLSREICVLALSLGLCACGFYQPASKPPLPARANKVVKTAYTQIGKNYRPGGASPSKGFDCSGLIWWAYKQNGIEVPRITTDQAKSGRSVRRGKVRSGDIVVFKTGEGPRGLHTGIYAGEGSFIHSPRSGKQVCMEDWHKAYWQKHLISIRRITK